MRKKGGGDGEEGERGYRNRGRDRGRGGEEEGGEEEVRKKGG